jgi:hypothetical protein
MKSFAKISWIVLILIFLAACGGASTSPTIAPEAIYTQAMETAFAQMTGTASASTNTPTIASSPQATPTLGVTNTPLISDTPGAISPQSTPQATMQATSTPRFTPVTSSTPLSLPTRGSTQVLFDNAKWVTDVTIPDGTEFDPGVSFIKTWRVENNGDSTWTYDYYLMFGWGGVGTDWMNTIPVKFGVLVAPGDILDISLTLTAPDTVGDYGATFRLVTDRDVIFGDQLTVSIKVK